MSSVAGVSFNQPKLCPNATWNSSGITVVDNKTIGTYPQGMFINSNNTIYVPSLNNGRIQIWLEGSTNPTGTIVTNATNVLTIFVTVKGDIYLSGRYPYNRVSMWRENVNGPLSTLNISEGCFSVFVDMNDSLYCSFYNYHKVIKRSLNNSDNELTTVAGTSCAGHQPDTLYYPRGIFVAGSFDLYVADCNNHRIQRFHPSQLNGSTVAGREVSGTIELRYPTAVMLDGDGYLFIADSQYCRIVGSGPYGFRCVIGCNTGPGSASNQLTYPPAMGFDSYGNIFVTDTNNHRVQKFVLSFNSCGK